MTDSTKFVQWLGDKVQAALTQARAANDPLIAWNVLDEVHHALESQSTMLFGAVISTHLPALQRELGPWVASELAKAVAALEVRVLTPLKLAAPNGLFGRFTAFFSGTDGTRDEAAAALAAQVAGLAIVRLVAHPDPTVRIIAARGQALPRSWPALVAQLERETELEPARAILAHLNLIQAEVDHRLLDSVAERFPQLRPMVLSRRLSHSEAELRALVTDPATRLDSLRALADPTHHRLSFVRDELMVAALDDPNPDCVSAALKGVRASSLLAAGERVERLARKGNVEALETLAVLVVENPALGFDLIVENARKVPPVLTGLDALAKANKLWLNQVDVLEGLLPNLPASAAAEAIRDRVERTKPAQQNGLDAQLEALEAAIDARPDDVDSWLVWSDAAQAAGDPRGNLVALAHAGQPVKEALLDLMPVLAPTLQKVHLWPNKLLDRCRLHMGLPREVCFDTREEPGRQHEVIAAVLGAPLGRFVTSVKLALTEDDGDANDWGPSLEALGRYGRVRSLLLGDFDYPDESEISWVRWGNIDAAFRLPLLEQLHVRGGTGDVSAMSSATLRELTIETGCLSRDVITTLVASKLPALTSLRLWTGNPEYGADTARSDIEAVLAWLPPSIRHLGIENCDYAHELVPLFANHAATKRLRSVSFSKGVLRPEDADLVCSHAAAFAHLETFDLSENQLDDTSSATIVSALPNAKVADQREDADGERFVAVGE